MRFDIIDRSPRYSMIAELLEFLACLVLIAITILAINTFF